MIHSFCLAAFSVLPVQGRTDLCRFAPKDCGLLVSVESRAFDARALHDFLSTLMRAPEGLPALLGPRARKRFEAALSFTKTWPDLAIGKALEDLARGGLLIGQAASRRASTTGTSKPDTFVILGFETRDQAHNAYEVFRTWLSLGKLLGKAGGQKILDSFVQSGKNLVFAERKLLRRSILDRMRGKTDLTKARLSDAFYSAHEGALLGVRLWLDFSRSLDKKNFAEMKNEPFASMLFAGLHDGLRKSGPLLFRADLDAGDEPRLSLALRLPGFSKGLNPGIRAVWDAGDAWLPAASENQILRFRIARDFSSFVKARQELLSARGEAELDKFLQGIEFGFQGSQAETVLLPDLMPGFSGMAALGNEENQVREGSLHYCLPQGLLAFGHRAGALASKAPAALRLFVIAGNANRKRNGKDLYRLRTEKGEGYSLSTAHIATRKDPRPLAASFEPGVASTKTSFYLSSSPSLLKEMFKNGERERITAADGSTLGNLLQVRGDKIALALLQNLDLARAQMVLRQGISYANAESRLRFLARLLDAAGRLDYRDGFSGEDLEARLIWSPKSQLFDPLFWNVKRRESVR